MHASISHAHRSRGYPSSWLAWPATPFFWHWFRAQSSAREPTGRSLGSTAPAGPRRTGPGQWAPFFLSDDSHNEASQALGIGTSAASVR